MKTNKTLMILVIAVILLVSLSIISPNLEKATFTSYSSGVPVQIGYDKSQDFWILTATVGWNKDTAVLIKLPKGSSDKIDIETAKTQSNVELTITPKGSYETAPLTKFPYYFLRNWNDKTVTYYYQVEGANWITTTLYDVSLNGQMKSVKVGMNYPADVDIGQGAFIKNLGIISNGANAPSGNFILIQNPDTNKYELYRDTDVDNSIKYARDNMPYQFSDFTWSQIWSFLKSKNWLPPKPVMTASSYEFTPTDTGNVGTIKMNYDKVAYSSFISVYIPSLLADTILLKIGASVATIIDSTNVVVTEADTASFTVTVRNDGGDDYVTVKATSQYGTVNPVTKFMSAGSTDTFTLQFYAYEITGDKTNLPISVTADGTDPYKGDTTTTVYATVYDRKTNPTPTSNDGTGGGTVNGKATVIKWFENPWFFIGIIITILSAVYYLSTKKR